MSFLNEMPTDNRYNIAAFQEMVYGEIGELLPAELVDACELENARAVLEIGCRAGEWLRGIAQEYPHLQCIGADQDKGMVMIANAQAQRDGLAQVKCFEADINDIDPELFPLVKFDLVHLSFLARYMLTVDYTKLARTCVNLCRPGGFICWAEAELPVTNSPAFERLVVLLCKALDKAGRLIIPESMMDPSVLQEQCARKRKLGKIYKRHHLGITPMIGLWLHQAGCGRINPSSEPARRIFKGYAAIPPDTYAIRLSNGSLAYKSFMQMLPQLLRRARLFLWGKGIIGLEEFDELCVKLEKELTGEDFYGLAFVARVWGKCW